MDTRKTGWALLVCCLFAGGALAAGAEVTDKEINEKILGKWNEEFEENGIKLKATLHYKKDGVFEAEGTVESQGKTTNLKVSGKWKVEDGHLVETYEKIEPEDFMEAGRTTKDKVLSIDDKTHTIRAESGKEFKRTRIMEK